MEAVALESGYDGRMDLWREVSVLRLTAQEIWMGLWVYDEVFESIA